MDGITYRIHKLRIGASRVSVYHAGTHVCTFHVRGTLTHDTLDALDAACVIMRSVPIIAVYTLAPLE